MRSCWALPAAAFILASVTGASAFEDVRPAVTRAFALTRGVSPVPVGWVDFCQRYPAECEDRVREPQPIAFSPDAFNRITHINRLVNQTIVAATDLEHFGVVDRWDLPTDGRGDCEDFALLKRKMLIAAGFPRQALLLTVVWDHDGNGHAVLTVHTTAGDFILDNLQSAVLAWQQTGYVFVKRQSEENEQDWVYLEEKGRNAPLVASK